MTPIFQMLIAYSLTINWDKITDPSVIGVKIYYGETSGNYTSSSDAGMQNSFTIDGFEEGERYYFAATAYNFGGLESVRSAEISTTRPITLAISASQITASVSVGKTYVLQDSQDLKTWTDYSSLVAASNAVAFAIDQSKPQAFFRLQKIMETQLAQSQVNRPMVPSAIVTSKVRAPKISFWTKIKNFFRYRPGMHFREPVHGATLLMNHTKPSPTPIHMTLPPMPLVPK